MSRAGTDGKRVTRRALALVLCSLALGVAGAARAEPPKRELVVFEAASLKAVFERLARRFEAENAGVTVVANAAGSQELRTQLEHGAGADVVATADRKTMDRLAAEELVGTSAIFTCNEPVVVVRAALDAELRTFADLPRAQRIVVGVPEVPIGAYTLQMLKLASATLGADFAARIQARIVSRELNVRQVLSKVALGEADAGVVYRSDASAAHGAVRVVEIPPAFNVTAEYPIAVVAKSTRADLARRFVGLVTSPAGTAALREAGFVPCAKR